MVMIKMASQRAIDRTWRVVAPVSRKSASSRRRRSAIMISVLTTAIEVKVKSIVVEALPPRLGAATALGTAALALAALAVAPETQTSTNSSDPAVPSSGPDTDPALPGAVAALAARAGDRMIVLRFDYRSWPDLTGFLVQAERTGVRVCVANPASALVVTSQFICTRSDIADGQVYWLTPVAP